MENSQPVCYQLEKKSQFCLQPWSSVSLIQYHRDAERCSSCSTIFTVTCTSSICLNVHLFKINIMTLHCYFIIIKPSNMQNSDSSGCWSYSEPLCKWQFGKFLSRRSWIRVLCFCGAKTGTENAREKGEKFCKSQSHWRWECVY